MYGNDGGTGTNGGNGTDEERLLSEFSDLDGENATERAFELGVADACEQVHSTSGSTRGRIEALAGIDTDRALRRLKETGDSTYDRSLIDLAYDEGRTRGMKLARREDDAEGVWSELVGDDTSDGDVPTTGTFEEALPGALGRVRALDIGTETGPPESLSLPEFLRSRGGPGRRDGTKRRE
ncbi:Uncharacterized protein AArcCO_0125 [Halalkaliarchaeum sp. AArc-CO]|uniref:hypothetical protein n=1 Tax=unclassified Halalkaliarchaeum TaxID=2678344 RepID=UPI00217EB9BE|nr:MULTISPECIES: hypothetical protein [unclassified Halalkaliarchaeum]MDR5674542.1 hypothetical protein [Halalkaliarchaeum sp. AArc-GB]UWG49457.1 Uncharacterized protein AArcCO_0125 [Halalkaliarchaeum sp. AArc-CO]